METVSRSSTPTAMPKRPIERITKLWQKLKLEQLVARDLGSPNQVEKTACKVDQLKNNRQEPVYAGL